MLPIDCKVSLLNKKKKKLAKMMKNVVFQFLLVEREGNIGLRVLQVGPSEADSPWSFWFHFVPVACVQTPFLFFRYLNYPLLFQHYTRSLCSICPVYFRFWPRSVQVRFIFRNTVVHVQFDH